MGIYSGISIDDLEAKKNILINVPSNRENVCLQMRPQNPQIATLLTLFEKLISRKINFYRLHLTLDEVALVLLRPGSITRPMFRL